MEFLTVGVYRDFMWKEWRRAVKRGDTNAAAPEVFFGFSGFDVAMIHFQMIGRGEGVWFRLKDGRVVDRQGVTCPSDASLYDQAVN